MLTLLGPILFVQPDSNDLAAVQWYYRLVLALFIPWSVIKYPNPGQRPWKDWYGDMKLSQLLSERIAWLISNLDLLHKFESEAQFNRLQRAA